MSIFTPGHRNPHSSGAGQQIRVPQEVEQHQGGCIEACQKTGWQVHAYCLMRNHFHLVAETPEPNLVEGMRWLLGTYTIRLNQPAPCQ